MIDEFIGQNPKEHAGLKTLARVHVAYTITLIHVGLWECDYENIKNIKKRY